MSSITIVDTETTGTDPKEHKLVELALARFDLGTGKLVDARSMLVQADQHGAEEIHGIPSALPLLYGTSEFNARTLLKRYAIGTVCLVAHNAEFDRQWFSDTAGVPWADSMDFEWPRKAPARNLTALALAHGVGVVAAHRALDDVLTLARVLERARELGADLEQMVKRALRPKVHLQALVSYDDRELAKAAAFQWDATEKRWTRRAFRDETFPFKTKEIER